MSIIQGIIYRYIYRGRCVLWSERKVSLTKGETAGCGVTQSRERPMTHTVWNYVHLINLRGRGHCSVLSLHLSPSSALAMEVIVNLGRGTYIDKECGCGSPVYLQDTIIINAWLPVLYCLIILTVLRKLHMLNWETPPVVVSVISIVGDSPAYIHTPTLRAILNLSCQHLTGCLPQEALLNYFSTTRSPRLLWTLGHNLSTH